MSLGRYRGTLRATVGEPPYGRFATACFFFSFFKTFLSFSDKYFLEKIQRKFLERVKKFDEKN